MDADHVTGLGLQLPIQSTSSSASDAISETGGSYSDDAVLSIKHSIARLLISCRYYYLIASKNDCNYHLKFRYKIQS